MSIKQLSNSNRITSPDHYVAGRTIELISVIETWKLNYHLANVLKYLCRAGRKNCEKTDLEKAIWYLDRYKAYAKKSGIEARKTLPETYSPSQVAQDWNLGEDLSNVLFDLYQIPLDDGFSHLERAKEFLKNRINTLTLLGVKK